MYPDWGHSIQRHVEARCCPHSPVNTLFSYYISQIPLPHSVFLHLPFPHSTDLSTASLSPRLLFVNTFHFFLTSAASRCLSPIPPTTSLTFSINPFLLVLPSAPTVVISDLLRPSSLLLSSTSLFIQLAQEIRAVCVIGSTGLLSCSSISGTHSTRACMQCVSQSLVLTRNYSLPVGMPLWPVV